ncbi:MAG TPA: HEAT repeat domain-containing protein, partial [Bryobacteraceae bacterium]|nr:HEAT repeat domain-containing protein [Bryobacteraceae bacterium]
IGFIPFAGMGYTVFKMVRKSDGSPVKARAAAALARDPDPQTTQALVKAVFGNPMLVEVAALGALAKRADPSVINDIMPAMYDSTDEVRFAAAAVVVRLSDVKPGAPVTTSSADKPQE